MSQLLPWWTGLCSHQTPLRFLINHPDTLTWDLSCRSALTVNYSAREGRVCEAEGTTLALTGSDNTPPEDWKHCGRGAVCSSPSLMNSRWALVSRLWDYKYDNAAPQHTSPSLSYLGKFGCGLIIRSRGWLVYVGTVRFKLRFTT